MMNKYFVIQAVLYLLVMIGCSEPPTKHYLASRGPLASLLAPGYGQLIFNDEGYIRYIFQDKNNREIFTIAFGEKSYSFLDNTFEKYDVEVMQSPLGDWNIVDNKGFLLARIYRSDGTYIAFLGTNIIDSDSSRRVIDSIKLRKSIAGSQ